MKKKKIIKEIIIIHLLGLSLIKNNLISYLYLF